MFDSAKGLGLGIVALGKNASQSRLKLSPVGLDEIVCTVPVVPYIPSILQGREWAFHKPHMLARPPVRVRGASSIDIAFLEREIFDQRTYLQQGVQVKPGSTVIDVGANIGFFTLQASQLAGNQGRVIRCQYATLSAVLHMPFIETQVPRCSCEPDSHTYAVLAQNVKGFQTWSSQHGELIFWGFAAAPSP